MIRPFILALLFPMTAFAAPRIVTDIPPIGSLAAAVAEGVTVPETLITGGGDSHHHQLRPSEARKVAAADLLIWVGPAMSPWLDGAAAVLGQGQQLVLTDQPGTRIRHTDDEGHEHDEGHENHGDHHHHDGIDPHLWLDPGNARLWLGAIAENLAIIDPANAATYRRNASKAEAAITAAEAEARAILADAADRPIVVSHDAYGYFTDQMGLPPALSLRDASDNAPSAGALRQLRAEIAASAASCHHPEPGDSAQSFAALDGTGLRQGAELDILGLAYAAPGPDLYPDMLTALARAIASCHADAAQP